MLCRSITRDSLGPYKSKVIGIPAVYFVSILIVDYVRLTYSLDLRHPSRVDAQNPDPPQLR